MKWLQELSISKKLAIIISFILLILLYGLINFWFSLKIMSSIRAYVGGEGLWSKAQKEAVNNLIKYSTSSDETDYQYFQNFLKVPLGDHKARLELNKPNPNLAIARQGFIEGGNNPEDVNDLIFLYQRFRRVSYMDIAIQDWTKGDEQIAQLITTGEKIHAIISSATPQKNPPLTDSQRNELESLVKEVHRIDKDLTVLENHFSATLGEGSRRIHDFLNILTFSLAIILGSAALFIAIYIGKIIVQVDNLKSEFVSLASHELRTPMAAIKGYTAMILSGKYGKLNPELKKPLSNISLANERLIELSGDLLNAARIDSKDLKPLLINTKSDNLIEEAISNLKSAAAKKNLQLKTDTLNTEEVHIDPNYLRQILNNLISNAIKFTEQGSVIISSTIEHNKQLIYIKDTGIGIAKSDQSKIFYKFQQIKNDGGGKPPGVGLGLYISSQLARKMGGNIKLASSLTGVGSTFIVSLPLAKP